MITTILLCWYCTGWAVAGIDAALSDQINLKDFSIDLIFGFVRIFLVPYVLLEKYGDKILWRRLCKKS